MRPLPHSDLDALWRQLEPEMRETDRRIAAIKADIASCARCTVKALCSAHLNALMTVE